ncbi:MAG: hypothetical protein ACO1TE_19880 [Prosthecobacter sp.]
MLWRSLLFALLPVAAFSADVFVTVEYPPSTQPGELIYGVTYTAWIPEGVKTVRGVIVHQHGCGKGACEGGATAAYDLHWQALAKKWDCALLGPSYHQEDGQDCRRWCDPRNGSEKTFLRALDDIAAKAGHPELARAPWCLWGHSGGGFWASLMQTLHPRRIAAIWFRSGTAYATWEKGEIPKPTIPEEAMRIPMMCNPGAKENGDKRFNGAWTGTLAMFHAYRAQGAPIGFAPDPLTSHQCGDSRYLAIPFFDACLEQRLPSKDSTVDAALRPIDASKSWLAPLLGHVAQPASEFRGKVEESVWLPDANVARDWSEYVQTGSTTDTTAPEAPTQVSTKITDGGILVSWKAEADFESGLQQFIVLRDGKEVGKVPEKPVGKFGRPLFQSMSYHDTPEKPLPAIQFLDKTEGARADAQYHVIAINSVGLKSE